MSQLKELLYGVNIDAVHGSTHVHIRNLRFNSSQVGLDDLFVAIKGATADGHQFIQDAINKGALVVVCEQFPQTEIGGITYVKVPDTKTALAIIAANFYENPAQKLYLVGVTGTNGKTTVSTLLYKLFTRLGYKCGLISTVKIAIGDKDLPATHTTPDVVQTNQLLAQMLDHGVTHCFMEVSSHGIHQRRVYGLDFDAAIFTNLSHDHLDYHKTFEAYRDTKKLLFDQLKKTAHAITNADDKNGAFMLQNTKAKKHTYALKSYADFKAKILENDFSGIKLKIDENELWVRLVGSFNAYNVLAVYSCAQALGEDAFSVLEAISALEAVEGRFQHFVSATGIHLIVDYAHTPDALENVLSTINDIRSNNETLYTIVGCGGNRDSEKRPIMAAIAAQNSNKVVLTSDNPRFESPETILEEMQKGIQPQFAAKVITITDRAQAIATACQMAQPGDILLIAGKGHEKYQEINGNRRPFDDFQQCKDELIKLEK
ncbi:MAG: UDP-N-acetylmuramoyl-L-alanyl-D-glutamate--2,6-diaminopimelate ligase [Flavobacteriaceae bacterium]|nr:UDP-N-acetylmuramoyl-L-alanyl-D-glutamate--2,6-diaminopimelate ligase [Flavobacteriaceae bacterium]